MKRAAPLSHVSPAAAFTLIEMIGVLAIMAILASVLVPNVLRSLDRAAVDAEAKTLAALGDQVKEYLRVNGAAPSSIWPNLANLAQQSWCSDLAKFSDLPTRDIAVNQRNNMRVIIFEPGAVPAKRIILISSMHAGPALPDSTYTPNAVQFQQLWDTQGGQVPPTSSWNGWINWQVLDGNNQMWLRHYLLIERIDLRPIYRPIDIRLWNQGTTTATYWTRSTIGRHPIGKDEILTVSLKPADVLYLSPDASGTNPTPYTVQMQTQGQLAPCYVFDGANWIPQP